MKQFIWTIENDINNSLIKSATNLINLAIKLIFVTKREKLQHRIIKLLDNSSYQNIKLIKLTYKLTSVIHLHESRNL